MMRSSRSVLLSPPVRWTTRRCWRGCGCTVSDPLLTQNGIGTGRSGRKQWKTRRANGGKKHKSEPKRLRFALETTYGPEGRGFESLTAYHCATFLGHSLLSPFECLCGNFILPEPASYVFFYEFSNLRNLRNAQVPNISGLTHFCYTIRLMKFSPFPQKTCGVSATGFTQKRHTL